MIISQADVGRRDPEGDVLLGLRGASSLTADDEAWAGPATVAEIVTLASGTGFEVALAMLFEADGVSAAGLTWLSSNWSP